MNVIAGSASVRRRGTCPTRSASSGRRRKGCGGPPYAEGALGIAVALGGKVVGIDLFDKAATMAKTWDRLVQGLVLDAAATPETTCRATASDVAVKLYALKNMRWRRLDPVFGLGEAYGGRSEDGVLATALVAGGGLVHLGASMSVVP